MTVRITNNDETDTKMDISNEIVSFFHLDANCYKLLEDKQLYKFVTVELAPASEGVAEVGSLSRKNDRMSKVNTCAAIVTR